MTLVTEKEAAEKWCPMARTAAIKGDDFILGVPVFNRLINVANPDGKLSPNFVASRCIGSRCMAWRWHKTHVKISDMYAEDCGFCGAFGKVEP